jgi:uncharacterized RDD family membrane protein YckC
MENNQQNNYDDYRNMVPNYSESREFEELQLRVGFGRRLGAYLLDIIIVGIITSIVTVSSMDLSAIESMTNPLEIINNPDLLKDMVGDSVIWTSLIGLVYYLSEVFIAASPGKLMLGIAIGDQSRFTANKQQLLVRYLIKYSSTVFSFLFAITGVFAFSLTGTLVGIVVFIGFFFVLGMKKQGFHDMLAKTAVFYKREIAQENNVNS